MTQRERDAILLGSLEEARTLVEYYKSDRDILIGAFARLKEAALAYQIARDAFDAAMSDPHADMAGYSHLVTQCSEVLHTALAVSFTDLAQQHNQRIRRETLIEAAAAMRASLLEQCAARRTPGHPLINNGKPSCEGYYERKLRCPDCPEESGAADILDELAERIM